MFRKAGKTLKSILAFSYIEILNCFLSKKHAVLVKKDCKRIEEVLRKVCSTVKSNLSYISCKIGGNYVKFASQSKIIAIRCGELLPAGELERELHELSAGKEALEEENKRLHEWSKDCMNV